MSKKQIENLPKNPFKLSAVTYYTVNEAAEILKSHYSTVFRLIKGGQQELYTLGGHSGYP